MGWLFKAFNATPPVVPAEYAIREGNDLFPIDREYADMGESEGWLVYSGYRIRNGTTYLEYVHV